MYLEDNTERDERQTGVVVGMRVGGLQHVAELVRVGRQQREVHHALSEVLLLLVRVHVHRLTNKSITTKSLIVGTSSRTLIEGSCRALGL